MQGPLKIIAGRSHRAFAEEICSLMSKDLTEIEIITFSNENMLVRILDNVREADVFLVQTSTPPVSDHFVETTIILDALRHSSAARVTAVIPYFPYVRSDKKDQPRISITAKLMAKLLQTAGADRFLTMELHSPQIQGFFDVPVDQLMATEVICEYFLKEKDLENYVIVAADVGEAKPLGRFANKLNLPMAIIDKRRLGNSDDVVPTHLIGDVRGKHTLIIDDEVASGGTLVKAAAFLKENGALSTTAAIVHPVLCGSAIEKINNSSIDELVVTNSIPVLDKAKLCPKIKVLSVAPLFAKAIQRIHNGDSISVLF
ncbi:MAG: ribose-phosphate pyrophosphokinase [Candidatus Lambdaproteobacteria bacterium RIFOXYD1_FULL_56_27]|uniref:ribose-phosphate diphosphokinase n=1 Tax=Candidatus Lambdaproteobacteria bacterium RIFOXYD2_FULL_56_26 TaxID=1817773 RepID=A0A1F6GPQ6_9PROT|nr:MAG: ribose-phosphate pyrophosphokinase [Candidatus Lambdaproteobacteria bacterium RIFOXYD2_FULL_56_26]OGH03935.1 MAG: ribose-phosphate pyrophosphokinase [Candidatus Lambdaproteobacteria bacterium RIFOXYC1_FULL_56_13]OGH06192.1 MAG: ribose-phosphate pyrophosphokinase [Candidatus Lambdaproteobacteria bacterium RIFOXYD1_FULL_56_27]